MFAYTAFRERERRVSQWGANLHARAHTSTFPFLLLVCVPSFPPLSLFLSDSPSPRRGVGSSPPSDRGYSSANRKNQFELRDASSTEAGGKKKKGGETADMRKRRNEQRRGKKRWRRKKRGEGLKKRQQRRRRTSKDRMEGGKFWEPSDGDEEDSDRSRDDAGSVQESRGEMGDRGERKRNARTRQQARRPSGKKGEIGEGVPTGSRMIDPRRASVRRRARSAGSTAVATATPRPPGSQHPCASSRSDSTSSRNC